MKKASWGFDTRDMDRSVRPQDDFYHYANGGWLKRNSIPPEESRWGSFLKLRVETEKKLYTLVKKTLSAKRVAPQSPEQMVCDFYRSAIDMKRRNALGFKPLRPWLERIEKIKDISSLVSAIAHLEKISGGPWGFGVDQDMKNSDRYIVYLHQSGLGMPDRDYYLKVDAESRRVRAAYEGHLEAMFALMGKGKAEARKCRETVMRIETALAKASMPKEDLRDVDKVYHKMSVGKLRDLTRNIAWSDYLSILGADRAREVVVMQPAFLEAVDTMLVKEPLEDWKTYLLWRLVGGMASYLTAALEQQQFAFYGTALSGVKVMKPLWRRALAATSGNLGQALGRLYVQRYFSPEARKKIKTLVADLAKAYEKRIRGLDWMSGTTKRKAVEKLRRVTCKLGYPDTWKSYRGLVVKPEDYAGNAIRATLHEHARVMRRLMKPVDRKEWFTTPQTVNAFCSQTMNEIVFPAAILQPPFFDPKADDAVNYGSIGSVIGHEMTHNFDDQGSKFDARGNRRTWWVKHDRTHFDKKAQILVKQFDTYRVADDIKVNGQLTLGENIADLGGVTIAYDAYQAHLAKTGREDIDGLTPEQRFFLGFALFERENTRPEFEKMATINDSHSPSIFRINGTLSDLAEFHRAFGIQKGDKLYRKQRERAKIW